MCTTSGGARVRTVDFRELVAHTVVLARSFTRRIYRSRWRHLAITPGTGGSCLSVSSGDKGVHLPFLAKYPLFSGLSSFITGLLCSLQNSFCPSVRYMNYLRNSEPFQLKVRVKINFSMMSRFDF